MTFGRDIRKIVPTLVGAFFIIALLPINASDWDEDVSSKSAGPKRASGSGTSRPVNITNNTPTKMYLKGQVEHSESLPALDPSMQAGSNFDSNAVSQSAKYASNWFQIPNWFAGIFQSDSTTIDFQKDYATGETATPNHTFASVGQESHGFQKDAKGNIWHFYVQSGSSKAEQAKQFTFNNIDWYGPEIVENGRVVMRIQATSLIVDKKSGVIVDSFRREDIKTYEPVGAGQIKVNYTSKSFDSHGRPRDLQNGHSVYKQISQFQAIDSSDGQNYKKLFADFLATGH